RLRHAFHRRGEAALRDPSDRGGRRRVRVARRDFRLPVAAPDGFPRPLGQRLWQWLPAHPVADRDRARQMARRGARQQRAEALLPAGGAHRLPLCRARRRAGTHRRAAHSRALRHSRLARVLHRAPRLPGGSRLPELSRRRIRALDRYPGLHQHRRQHGGAADQGTDSAPDELRALESHRDAGLGGNAAAYLPRDDAGAARFGYRHGAGCRMTAGPILIMAGGTGGHVFPALALARRLREQSVEVIWLGTRRGLEARVIPAEGIAIDWLAVGGLRGKGWRTLLAAPWRLTVALVQALRVMRRRRPVIVVGLGGFVTGPGGVAAWLTRRPLVIHEQNAIAGFTNRCLAHLAREVLEAFPDSFGSGVKARTVGNPVRRDIIALTPPAERFSGREGAVRILVIGGSLGAVRLNTVVPYALARLAGTIRFDVRHQAGERWIEAGRQSYADAGVRADVRPFIEDMSEAYGWADLVICRSGALTVSELAAA